MITTAQESKSPVNVEPIQALSELELAFVGGGVGEATFG
jgi:hypothetical protein